MAYSAKAIANEFLELAKEKGTSLSPMKLQKLVYFAHGWSLVLRGKPLIEERIEAWQYGPVIPVLYREFKSFGNAPISMLATELDIEAGRFLIEEPRVVGCASEPDPEEALALIRKVWDAYGKYSAVQLSNATHAQGTPWQLTYQDGARGMEIPDAVICDYFTRLKDRNGQR